MNAISEVTSWLKTQNVGMNYDGFQNKNVSEKQKSTDTNSFFSILKLLDVNADAKIDSEELKFGAGFMINSMIQSKDLNGDEALSAGELGVSPAVVAQLDTDLDGTVGAKELITPADKIIDGLVSLLDVNGDKALSREELAIFELLFNGISSASGKTELDTNTIFARKGDKLELNMDTIPDRMRQAGFQGSDNALYYALAHVYKCGPDKVMPDDEAGSLAILNTQRNEIYNWFDGEIAKVKDILKKDPQATVTAITNDGKDKCGFRLGSAIMERLTEYGDRVQLGTIFPESGEA